MQKLPKFSEMKQLQKTLQSHRLYGSVKCEKNVKIFMEDHIFAVWDFMVLLKQLQRKLTCMDKIWLPPQSNNIARFINEIVVGQQSDIHPDGKNHASHFQLYLEAMKEAGADTSVVLTFVKNLSEGKNIHQELKNSKISEHVRNFVSNTLSAIDKPTSYVASQFFYGRQDPIPQMFEKFVHSLDENTSKNFNVLKYYLKRHIEVDGGEHGPMAQKLLTELANKEDQNYEQILDGAINALTNRIKLWDGIYSRLIL